MDEDIEEERLYILYFNWCLHSCDSVDYTVQQNWRRVSKVPLTISFLCGDLEGGMETLLENIGNVVLFIPLGIFLKWVGVGDVKRAGFFASFLIEILQCTFALGTFECDDLINNTLGAVIGAWGWEDWWGVLHHTGRADEKSNLTLHGFVFIGSVRI